MKAAEVRKLRDHLIREVDEAVRRISEEMRRRDSFNATKDALWECCDHDEVEWVKKYDTMKQPGLCRGCDSLFWR